MARVLVQSITVTPSVTLVAIQLSPILMASAGLRVKPAIFVSRKNHLSRVCPNQPDGRDGRDGKDGRDGSNGKKVATVTTPAQKRFAAKSAGKRESEKKVINHIDGSEDESQSEDESDKDIGAINDSESDEDMVLAIERLRKKFGKKKIEKQLRRVNVVDENVNAISVLPFLHGKLVDQADNKALINILFDTGSSVSLVSKKFLDDNSMVFQPIPYESTLVGFQGNAVNCHIKGRFKLCLETGTVHEVELIVMHAKNLSYDMIMGFDLTPCAGNLAQTH